MSGGITFRDAIEINKKAILSYLTGNGKQFTSDICYNYSGQKEMPAVRKALNELRKEGKVESDDKVSMWQGKSWWIKENKS